MHLHSLQLKKRFFASLLGCTFYALQRELLTGSMCRLLTLNLILIILTQKQIPFNGVPFQHMLSQVHFKCLESSSSIEIFV